MRIKDLKIELSKVKSFATSNTHLEQYITPSDIASHMAYMAHTVYNDITSKYVLDLCCGTGMLSIATSFFKPRYLLAVDICPSALEIARQNFTTFGVHGDCIRAKAQDLPLIRLDTCFMNPPFGTKKKHADVIALDAALLICDVVYSMHKSSTRKYLTKRYPGAKVLAEIKFELPRTHSYHKKEKVYIQVDLIRFANC